MHRSVSVALLATCMIFNLTGCKEVKDTTDLQQLLAQLKKKAVAEKSLLDDFHLHTAPNYSAQKLRSPFPEQQIVKNIKDYNKFPLEQYPLDALHLIGIITQGSQDWAVIMAPDNKVYQVTVGDMLGNQQGKISSIEEYQVSVTIPAATDTDPNLTRVVTLQLKDQ